MTRDGHGRSMAKAIVDAPTYLGPPCWREIDWASVEKSERIEFPADYKWLCENYGPLRFGEYWMIAHPRALQLGNRRLRLEESAYGVNDVRWYLARRRRDPWCVGTSVAAAIPYRCYPDVPGLLRWGNHDEVTGLMWLTHFRSENWSVVISDLDRWWRFDGGMLEFIVGMLAGTVDCPIIPGGWVGFSVEEDVTPAKRPTWELRGPGT